ncbi:outer membrane protein assembly factor BamC [Proteobacteria bacterium 005FR1]|nr:outer membrane protein assembly factor BamC [Proteobacteria bacterium 005FR1]
MKYSLLKWAVLASAVNLAGCGMFFGEEGYFRDRGDDYLKSGSIPPMQVPEGMDKEAIGQLYVIPNIDKAAYEYPTEFETPRPEALSSNAYSESVKIQKLGDERWIFVNASPSEVWPRVRNFLNSNGLAVARTDAPRGVIETAWLNFKDDPTTRDKYRLRIEQGVQPDSSEVHVTHYSMSRDDEPPAQVNWPEKSSNVERESGMVNELAANLAAEIGSASASLLAQNIGGAQKVEIVADEREPVLRMELQMIRAWATLSHALQQEGLQIVDENSSKQMFYVQQHDPEEGEGFFSGWFSRAEPAQSHTVAELLEAMDLEDTEENRNLFPPEAFLQGEKRLADVPGYLFVVTEGEDAIKVAVRDASGQRLNPRQARELLGMVRRNLI